MQGIREIKEVEPKPEVNIFLRKPFVSDENRDNQKQQNQGFQKMLDESMEQLKKEGKSFEDVVHEVETDKEEATTVREYQLLQLKNARKQYEIARNFRSQHENEHSFDEDIDKHGPSLK